MRKGDTLEQNNKLIRLNKNLTNEVEKEEASNKKRVTRSKAKVETESSAKSFRMISKIEPQKAKGRYNIFIDDAFAFGVDEEVLIKFELNRGLHIPKELQTKIENEESYYKAYNKTLNYLSYSLRSEKQIKDYLIKNEFEHYLERMIEHLKKIKLIDDLVYAQSYVRTQANINQKGPRNIIQELYRNGVSESEVMTALEEYPYEQQFENATELASKQWKKMKKHSATEGKNKVKRYLLNKGYSFEMIDEVLQEVDLEKNEDEEYEALLKQAIKVDKRYARKYEGYELKQRLKAFLFSKGYPTELINRYFDEKDLD